MITVNAKVSHSANEWTIAQIAAELGIDPGNCRKRYVNRLVHNGHQQFRNYEGGPLTDVQKSVVIEFRRLSKEVRLRGDSLLSVILKFPPKPSYLRKAITEVFIRHGISTEKADQMIKEILEVFNET